jgi:hypothetical protein
MDTQPPEIRDLQSAARERVKVGSAPDWITPGSYDPDFKATVRGPLTYLLIERQVNAELHQTYVRASARLETMQAVQHQSQWRLEFEPQTQSIVLHSIKVRRGSTEREHASLVQIQFLQREAGLEGLVVDGWITLLLVLEDVIPGDVLEWSYTLTDRPKLLPEHLACFFFLPAGAEIGKYHFSVRHAEARNVKWKSLVPNLDPTTDREGSEIRICWIGEKMLSPEPEQFTPEWQLNQPWIQISDCPDWHTVARGVLHTWKEDEPGDGLKKLAEEVKSVGPDLVARVNRAVSLVQEGFRYLSVNLELGGQVPASAEVVIRRRYGDCKDVAFLLVRLLHAVGVTAKPVLVHTVWRKAIASMLPSPSVFNHVVVEFEVENEKRWVDATAKCQGGGALTRRVSDFGLGLPIDTSVSALAPVPAASLPSGAYEVKECFVLDTSGNPSSLGINIIAKGIHAEELRFEFENEGVEAIAKKRLQISANRFTRAARIGQLQFHDDREQNIFETAEAFEIDGFLKQHLLPETCTFIVQSDFTAGMLLLPSSPTRQTLLALPFPCTRVHSIEIHHNGLQEISVPAFNVGNKFFSFSRRCKSLPKYFKATFSFSTHADSMPPDQLPEHRKRAEEVWQASAFQIGLPLGFARMGLRTGLGRLSTPPRKITTTRRPEVNADPARKPAATPPVSTSSPTPNRESPPRRTEANAPAIVGQEATIRANVHPRPPGAQPTPPALSRASRGRMNQRCIQSLWVFLAAIALFLIGGLLSSVPGASPLVGVLCLSILGILTWSLILAVVGLRQCASLPDRYPRGKVPAIATLVFGGLFLLALLTTFVGSIRAGMARSQLAEKIRGSGFEQLRFDALNFNYQSPSPPWVQTDARTFGRGTVLAFVRPEPMYFSICANPLEAGFAGDRGRIVQLSMSNVLAEATSYHSISEGEVTRNGLAGWQIEGRGNFQGREFYLVNWLLATNHFGYQLSVWGPTALSSDIKREADNLFSNFSPANLDR